MDKINISTIEKNMYILITFSSCQNPVALEVLSHVKDYVIILPFCTASNSIISTLNNTKP